MGLYVVDFPGRKRESGIVGELTILVGHDMLISLFTNGAVDVRHDSRPSVSQLGRRIFDVSSNVADSCS